MDKNGQNRGRPRKIKGPEELAIYWLRYKQWCEANPSERTHFNAKTDTWTKVPINRPYIWEGFETWINLNTEVSGDLRPYRYNYNNSHPDFVEIIHTINSEIFARNVSGAACGDYQHNIIARQLGMVDRSETEVKSVPASREEIEERLKLLDAKIRKLPGRSA